MDDLFADDDEGDASVDGGEPDGGEPDGGTADEDELEATDEGPAPE
jgi:hypothetical protein